MPSLTPAQLIRTLSRSPGGAVVFLHGEEAQLREEAVREIVDHFLDPATRDFNLDELRGADVTPEALASVVSTPPMMAEHRLVVLRDAQGLGAKGREVVEATAARCPPGLVLVVTAVIPSGSKAKFYSMLQRTALAVEFGPIDPLDLPGWLIERAREEHGLELDLDAARALAVAIGNTLGVLSSELEKLAAYVGERRRVAVEDVRAVGGYLPRHDRWQWFDLVAERRFAEALRQLPGLLESGENGVGLVIGLTSQLLRVGLVASGGVAALERELKPYQRWLAQRVAPLARRWTATEVDEALAELLRTDRLLKTTPLTDRQLVEELLLRLAAVADERRDVA